MGSSAICEGPRVDLILINIKRSQLGQFRHLVRKTPRHLLGEVLITGHVLHGGGPGACHTVEGLGFSDRLPPCDLAVDKQQDGWKNILTWFSDFDLSDLLRILTYGTRADGESVSASAHPALKTKVRLIPVKNIRQSK